MYEHTRQIALGFGLGCTIALSVMGCSSGGNLKSDNTYHGSKAAAVAHPLFDPYGKPGDVPTTWAAPTYDRYGTIVAPNDPSVSWPWEDYRHAPWMTGAGGSGPHHPPGTF